MRIHWPRRVFAQVLTAQLVITTGVTVLATGLFLAPLSHSLDDQAMRRALAIAETAAADPELARDVTATAPAARGPVQSTAERIRRATGALYVVVMDTRGVRWSHTNVAEIGHHVSTDPSRTLAGAEVNGGAWNMAAPFGGYKQSGHGRENGVYGLEEYLEYKSMQLKPAKPA